MSITLISVRVKMFMDAFPSLSATVTSRLYPSVPVPLVSSKRVFPFTDAFKVTSRATSRRSSKFYSTRPKYKW